MEARLYLNLSVVKENLEDFDDSIQFMEKALTLCRKNELFELLHQCYLTAALFYHIRQNENTKALRSVLICLLHLWELGQVSQLQATTSLAKVLYIFLEFIRSCCLDLSSCLP